MIAKACNEPNSVGPTMQDFTSWVMKNSDPTKLRVWSCGANFDTVILEHLLGQLRLPVPYSFWNVRCYRTLKSMFQIEGSRAGVAHRALDDAKHQAHWAAEYLKKHPECDR